MDRNDLKLQLFSSYWKGVEKGLENCYKGKTMNIKKEKPKPKKRSIFEYEFTPLSDFSQYNISYKTRSAERKRTFLPRNSLSPARPAMRLPVRPSSAKF